MMRFTKEKGLISQKRSGLKHRLVRQGRRIFATLICVSLTLGGFPSAFFQAFGAKTTDKYIYEFDPAAIHNAITAAIDKSTTLDTELKFTGDYAGSYEELFDPDGTLYELKDLETQKDRDRDRDLSLRVFIRLEGSVSLDESYEIEGTEPVIFLLSNKTAEEVNTVIRVDDHETETISVLPAGSVPNAKATSSSAVKTEGIGYHGGNAEAGSAGGKTEKDDKSLTDEGTAEDAEADVNEEPDKVREPDEDSQAVGAADADKDETDKASEAEEDAGADKSSESEGDAETDESTKAEGSAEAGGGTEADGSTKADGSEKADGGSETSDDEKASHPDEASFSRHKKNPLRASLTVVTEADIESASASNASPSDASPSDADRLINGTVFDPVLFGNKGTVAFVTTLEDIGLDRSEDQPMSLTWEGDDYTVTVCFSRSAGIPEDAELEVSEYLPDSDTFMERYEEAADLYEWEIPQDESGAASPKAAGIDFHLFNISLITSDAEEIDLSDEHNNEMSVTISYPGRDREIDYILTAFPEDRAEDKETESDYEEGTQIISFETYELGDFGIALLDAVGIYSYEELFNAIDGKTGVISLELAADIQASNRHITLSSGADVTLDLNGHVFTAQDGNSSSLFTIPSNAALTVIDSQSKEAVMTESAGVEARDAGELASTVKNWDGSVTLTYYVTESDLTNAASGYTQETRYEYSVTSSGMISTSGNHALFSVTGGTLNINSGFYFGDARYTGSRAIDADSGTVNLSGGYICGFYENYSSGHAETVDGGAVRVSGRGTTLNISGTAVLADNKAATGGAVDVAGNAVLNMSGGVISGNEAREDAETDENNTDYGGGGIHLYNSTAHISGGYVTNNLSDCEGYFDGGGGILVWGSELYISGGYITGNKAASGGGGIRTNFNPWNSSNAGKVYITGGYICANYAVFAEGGGICIDNGGLCTVKADAGSIYINNNVTDTEVHWGGGGLFCANGATAFIEDVLVTDNLAGGYGGGVAGCSTGRIAIAEGSGAAIYDNSAEGVHLSGADSVKNEDHTYGELNEIFLRYGYQDYFCALESQISGTMLGGGSANWRGSADGEACSDVGAGQILHATNIMGLTAYPSEDDIAKAKDHATVYFTGNSSYTHGGGLLSNGYLLIGDVQEYEIGDALEIDAEKTLIDNETGEQLQITEDNSFTFSVTNELGAVVSKGTVLEGGSILFDRRLSFDEPGTFTFTISEDASEDANIFVDTSVYTLLVTVSEQQGTITLPDEFENVTYRWYYISNYKLYKNGELILEQQISNPSTDSVVHLTMPVPAFTNYITDKISITVEKVWAEFNDMLESVEVTLYQNGTEYGEQIILNDNNDWRYTWTDLQATNDQTGEAYVYEVKETETEGYVTSYETTNSPTADNSYWVPLSEVDIKTLETGTEYLIVYENGADSRLLGQRSGREDVAFETDDSIPVILETTEPLKLGGKTYDRYISGDDIPSGNNVIWNAVSDSKGTLLKNANLNSWLLLQDNGGNYLKGTNGAGYASDFKIEGRYLLGSDGYNATTDYRYVIYQNGRFTSSYSNTNAATIYVKLNPVTTSTTVTITNTKVDKADYTLNITKVNALDGNLYLPDATFQLFMQGDDEALDFTEDSAGLYTWYDSENQDPAAQTPETTKDLITVTLGKLVIRGLPAGIYILRETKAPENYIPADDIEITLDETTEGMTVFLEVKDEPAAPELPNTGGPGSIPFRVLGPLISASALYLLCIAKKRSKICYYR